MSQSLRRLKTFNAILASLFALLLLSFTIAQSLLAQAGGASIAGHITDKTGAIVRDAEVDITNKETGVKVVTASNGSGIYSFPSLPPGKYVLSVHKEGFRSVDAPDLTMYTQDDLERNFVLEVGSVSESVTVAAQTTNQSPAVSLTVSREFVENTPLNGRSFQDLIQLAPGVTSTGGGAYSVDGQRPDSNNYMVDGVSATLGGLNNTVYGSGSALSGNAPMETVLGTTQSLASVDALQEFQIQTSGYTSEYGRNPGGQIQFKTRSGTNTLHGSLSEYFRNTVMDANSNVNDSQGYPKTAEHQNDFGGTLGGPVILPHIYKGKDKTFYFLSYEGLRLLLPSTESEYVSTQAFRNLASPNVQPFLNTQPLPTPNSQANDDGCTVTDPNSGKTAACDALFYYAYSYPNRADNFNLRIDHAINRNYTAFVRYADTPSSTITGAEQIQNSHTDTHTWTVGLTANPSRSLLNELRFNYTRDSEGYLASLKSVAGSMPFQRSLLVPAQYLSEPYAGGIAFIYVPGSSLLIEPDFGGSSSVQHQYQLSDSVALESGKHSFKFGADFRRLAPLNQLAPYGSTIEILSLEAIQQGQANAIGISTTGATSPVFDNLSVFAQDHWSPTTRLTVDFGLRWEFNPPPGPANNQYPATLTSNDLSTTTLIANGSSPYPTRFDKFAPRLGFSWNAISSRRFPLTIRGGFGVFFDTGQSAIANQYSASYPFKQTELSTGTFTLPLSSDQLTPPATPSAIKAPYPYPGVLTSPGLTLPYTEQWTLSLDEMLTAHNKVTASYVGNNGHKLLLSQQYGSDPFGNDAFPSGFTYLNNSGQSGYNSLQIQDVGRVMNGFDIVASFTYAHAIDNASNDIAEYAPQWGNSNYDVRKILNAAINYRPQMSDTRGIIGRIANGWLISNRFTTQSGTPFNVIQSFALLPNTAKSEYFPDLVPHTQIYLHGAAADLNGRAVPGRWRLNRAAFACTTNGSTTGPCSGAATINGDLGRNFLRTPPFWDLNTSVQRVFPIRDSLHVSLRADAFNIFNHPNFTGPDNSLSDSTFGILNATNAPNTIGSGNELYAMGAARSIQLSLKLEF
jgi:hypothetical protein